MPTQAERLARLEATVPAIHADVTEIKGDVKTLLAAHNRQSGAIRLGTWLWAGALSLGGLAAGMFLGKPHA